MTKAKQIEFIKVLARAYKVRVCFKDSLPLGVSGSHVVNPKTGKDYIVIARKDDMISTFFHELGHTYCYHNRRWPTYHRCDLRYENGEPLWTKKILRGLIKTSFRAELWVDNWAKKELKKILPKYKYTPGYLGRKWVKKWYYENYLYTYIDMLQSEFIPEDY